eukprot:1349129-Rhodomonas_salina.4
MGVRKKTDACLSATCRVGRGRSRSGCEVDHTPARRTRSKRKTEPDLATTDLDTFTVKTRQSLMQDQRTWLRRTSIAPPASRALSPPWPDTRADISP